MHTASRDFGGSSTLLKKVSATTLAMSTRFDVAAMASLMGEFIGFSDVPGTAAGQ
jgi:hypothetical protein